MEQAEGAASKGHQRTRSAAKASRPRSSTKGPLDADEVPLPSPMSPGPLSPQQQQQQRQHQQHQQQPPAHRLAPGDRATPTPTTPGFPLPARPGGGPSHHAQARLSSPLASPRRAVAASPQKDFSHLLRPEIYHPLTALNVPAPFRAPVSAAKQPAPDTPIPELLARGHFRAAAVAAARALTDGVSVSPTDHARVLDLLYVRLACLTLLPGGGAAMAAQEARALEDLGGARYVDDATGAHLAPWPLRVLLVRLQALGFGDPRRAVMAYYDLAREARAHIAAAAAAAAAVTGTRAAARRSSRIGTGTGADAEAERRVWRDRLADLGVRVAGALIEMDDLAGAAHHLATLKAWPGERDGDSDSSSSKIDMARALLWLHLGDVDAARQCVARDKGDVRGGKVVTALCDMADGEYEKALARWRQLREEEPEDEMVAVNMAVCLLYLGRMSESKDLLENLVDASFSSHPLLFNLTTIYELSTERARDKKLRLAERVAAMDESPYGWEKANTDFKLD